MMNLRRGTARSFGDAIDTDIIIPARYLMLPLDEMKDHTMEPIRRGFADEISPGDIIVAGKNFGCGSSREQAPAVLRALGISAVVAKSFARIFFRNAVNLGLPVIECVGLPTIEEGSEIEVDFASGTVRILATGEEYVGSVLPDFLLEIIEAGGLIPHLKQRAQQS